MCMFSNSYVYTYVIWLHVIMQTIKQFKNLALTSLYANSIMIIVKLCCTGY